MSEPQTIDFQDVREFLRAVCETAQETSMEVMQKNCQGTTVYNTWLGFTCGGKWFRFQLSAAKALQKPLRPYLQTTEQRDNTARRITEDPQELLQEMESSGGWAQPDPGVALLLALAAATGSPEAEKELHKVLKGSEPEGMD